MYNCVLYYFLLSVPTLFIVDIVRLLFILNADGSIMYQDPSKISHEENLKDRLPGCGTYSG